ncbi:hypothetical protein B0A55_09801 [Friedmanniomyces simplex]|uniref:Uncharacterized protein n=1 Tax=Friedmanniomyces simplex TaxID=329884 RepID=A0A4U0WMI4_9PEZI|nr:hypothetical protein B0A55_09801 [Friedmanniomyces simplex]
MTPEEYNIVGNKLVHYGESFDSNPDAYLPLLHPALTKAGRPRVRQPYVVQKSKAYWQAQCSFGNLRVTGSVGELQTRIRTRNIARDAQIALEADEACKSARRPCLAHSSYGQES